MLKLLGKQKLAFEQNKMIYQLLNIAFENTCFSFVTLQHKNIFCLSHYNTCLQTQ